MKENATFLQILIGTGLKRKYQIARYVMTVISISCPFVANGIVPLSPTLFIVLGVLAVVSTYFIGSLWVLKPQLLLERDMEAKGGEG